MTENIQDRSLAPLTYYHVVLDGEPDWLRTEEYVRMVEYRSPTSVAGRWCVAIGTTNADALESMMESDGAVVEYARSLGGDGEEGGE